MGVEIAALEFMIISSRARCVQALTNTRPQATLAQAVVPCLCICVCAVFAVSGGKRIPDSAGGAPRGAVELWRDYGKQMGTCDCGHFSVPSHTQPTSLYLCGIYVTPHVTLVGDRVVCTLCTLCLQRVLRWWPSF